MKSLKERENQNISSKQENKKIEGNRKNGYINELPKLLSIEQVMQLYKRSKQTIKRRVKQKKLPVPIVDGGQYLFFYDEIMADLESKRLKPCLDTKKKWSPF